MSEKIIKSRIIHKHGLEAHWLLATNFIPKQGEIIVYDIEVDADGNVLELPKDRTTPYTHQRLKIGDGITAVSELPFVVGEDEGDTNMEKGTGEGATQQVTDDETFTVQNEYINNDSNVTKDASGNITTGALGAYSSEFGGKSQAKGKRALAEGTSTVALGSYSHAEGNATFTKGPNAHAEGQMTSALAQNTHAEGSKTTAHSDNAHSEGYETNAVGYASHAEGITTTAQGEGSHAEGALTEAKLNYSHAEGYDTHAKGESSHSEGHGTVVGDACHAQHVQGSYNKIDESNRYAHIVGNGSDGNNRSNAHTIDWNGAGWFAGDVRVGGTSYDDAKILATEEYTQSAIQEQLAGSPLTFYDAETIKNNIVNQGWYDINTYVEDGYACAHRQGVYDILAGIKVEDGVVDLRYVVSMGGLNAGVNVSFLIGELNATAGAEYVFPRTQMSSSEGETVKVYVAELTGGNALASGAYIQTGSKDNPEMSGVSYSTGYYDGFTFTAPSTKKYGIWVEVYTNDYYWAVVSSGTVADLTSLLYPIDKYATKKYVDDAIANSSGPEGIVTTDNLAEALYETGVLEAIGEAVDTKVDKTSDANKVYGTDANGNQTKVAYGYSALVNNIPLRTANGNISVPETPGSDNSAASKKYVDDRALTDSHKSVLDFIASKIGTANLVFGTDANGQLTAMSINDLAAAIMQALPAAEEGEF